MTSNEILGCHGTWPDRDVRHALGLSLSTIKEIDTAGEFRVGRFADRGANRLRPFIRIRLRVRNTS